MTSIDDPDLNVIQTYSSRAAALRRTRWRVELEEGHASTRSKRTVTASASTARKHRSGSCAACDTIARNIPVAPNNVGPKTFPNYDAVANQAITELPGGGKVFAGQRDDPFFVDLGRDVRLRSTSAPGTTGATGRRQGRPRRLRRALDRPAGARGEGHQERRGRRLAPTTRTPSWACGPPPSARAFQCSLDNAATSWDNDAAGRRRLRAGLAPGQPARQRGHHPARQEGHVQPHHSGPRRRAVRQVRRQPGAGASHERPVPGRRQAPRPTARTSCWPCSRACPASTSRPDKPVDTIKINLGTPPAASPNRLGVIAGDMAGYPNGRRLTDDVVDIDLRSCGRWPTRQFRR